MNESIVIAVRRTEKAKKVRREGFIPGVVYGDGIEGAVPVKFNKKVLNRVLRKHTKNARLQVKLGSDTKICIVKEVQRDPINGDIQHIDMQAVTADKTVRVKIPIVYNGRELLEDKKLLLHIFVSEVEAAAKATKVPEFITVDVSTRKSGDRITVRDLKIDDDIKIFEEQNKVIAVITESEELDAAS